MNIVPKDDRAPEILVILPGRNKFGANLVFVPALLHLRREYPGARIIALANHAIGPFFARVGLVDEVWRLDTKETSVLSVFKRTMGLKPDLVVNCRLQSLRMHIWTLLIRAKKRRCFANGIGRWIGVDARPWDGGRYKAFTYLDMVGAGGDQHPGDLLSDWPRIPSIQSVANTLVLIPCGSKESKKWPLSSFLEIARRWRRDQRGPVQVLAGPGEPEVIQWVATDEAKSEGVTVVSGGLGQEIAALRGATMVVANDCAPAHLAQMLDCPRVVLFRAITDPAEWFRPGEKARMIKAAVALADIPVDDVWAAVSEVLSVCTSRKMTP